TAVLLLVADGKVGLETPIGDYLDGLPAPWRPITIRRLLSYTSGLPDVTQAAGGIDLIAGDWEHAFPLIASAPLEFEPGHGWSYSQTNYALLLRLVEKISGVTFETFLAERLFKPLAMSNTFFPGPGRGCARTYGRDSAGHVTERPMPFPHFVHAAGGLCSSLDDMVIWARALDGGKLLPAALSNQAWSPTKLADGSLAKVGSTVSYGLGWAIGTTGGRPWVGHSGGNSTAFRRYPKAGMTVIILHNGDSDPDSMAEAVAGAMLNPSLEAGGQDALWDAASDGDAAAAKAAIRAGANVNALDTRSSRNGRFPLNWAAFNDHADTVLLLLRSGARIDAQNLSGFTALHHAAERGSLKAAQALIDAGANRSLRNANGETAAEVATRNGHADIAAMLAKAPAKHGA
ncbi:MAG: serine hydrolase, partial [Sphingomicrobium sp.]